MNDEPIQVLLIEDSPTDALIVQVELTQFTGIRFSIIQVDRLTDALQRLKEQRFSVVLLDLSLPDSDGFETFTRLREASPDVPIVVLSGRSDEKLAIRAVKAGAQDYLVKGHMEDHVLARTIRHAIERKRGEEALRMPSRVLESMMEGVGVSDPAGMILFSNGAFDAMFGYERGSLVGENVSILRNLPPDENKRFTTRIAEELERTGKWNGKISNRKKDGTAVLTQVRITSLVIEGEKCAVAIHEDITQRNPLE